MGIIDKILDIANKQRKKDYPLSDNHFKKSDVVYILKALLDYMEERK